MNTTICRIFCALALSVLAGAAVWAGPPSAPTTGKVLVLEKDRILEGDIELVGDRYRIKRSIGETWLPASKAQALCANMEDAYHYLRAQANRDDADECLRLARWCQVHDLKEQALAEASAALQIRPSSTAAKWLLHGLQRSVVDKETAIASNKETDSGMAEMGAELPPLDFNSESLGLFVTKVQPILMNTCASCHASGRGGAFKLIRCNEAALTSRRATNYNLAAVLAQVNRDQPLASSILDRALIAHSGNPNQPAPLKGRNDAAFQTLERWVQSALADRSQKTEVRDQRSEVRGQRSEVRDQKSEVRDQRSEVRDQKSEVRDQKSEVRDQKSEVENRHDVTAAGPLTLPKEKPAFGADRQAEKAPDELIESVDESPAQPTDEFDPMIFNRHAHSGH